MALLPWPRVQSIHAVYEFDLVFDFLGSGQFATVYQARRKITSGTLHAGTEVALKIISKRYLYDDKSIKDVLKEVEILRKLKHRHCVQLYEVLQTDTDVYIVQQLVKNGGELFQVISSTRITESAAATITKQILRAVKYLHLERRVVHRDLKPENILVRPKVIQGESINENDICITLVDFGLAKYLGTGMRRQRIFHALRSLEVHLPSPSSSMDSVDSVGSHSNSPVMTTPVGTMKYSNPETLRNMVIHGQNPRSTTRGNLQKVDIFSVGIIVYVMLCGQIPFSGTSKHILASQMEVGPKFTGPCWQHVSDDAKDFVSRLLHPKPEDRPGAAGALEHAWIQKKALPDEDDEKSAEVKMVLETEDEVPFVHMPSREDLSTAFSAILEAREAEVQEEHFFGPSSSNSIATNTRFTPQFPPAQFVPVQLPSSMHSVVHRVPWPPSNSSN